MSTHNIPFFNMKKKNTLNYPKSAAIRIFSKGLKKEFERAVVNEPSVFEPLKFYCIWIMVGHGPIALAVAVDRSCLDLCLSSISSRFFLHLSGRQPGIRLNSFSKDHVSK